MPIIQICYNCNFFIHERALWNEAANELVQKVVDEVVEVARVVDGAAENTNKIIYEIVGEHVLDELVAAEIRCRRTY